MTTFQIGDMVTAKMNAQGLRDGESYEVVAINEQPTAFGNYVEYRVASIRPTERGFEWSVVNAHLIMEKTESVKRPIKVDGKPIILEAKPTHTEQFGTIWFADNNYGEPKTAVKGHPTAKQALDVEEIEVRQMLKAI
jgi:hypothetical protein